MRPRIESKSRPLMSLARVQSLSRTLAPALLRRALLDRPPMRSSRPFSVSRCGQRPTPGFHTWLCSVFRLSQPLDVLLRPHPLGLVSCRIRSWDSHLQRFPPPGSHHDSHRGMSFLPFPHWLAARAAPRIDAPKRSVLSEPVLPGTHWSVLSWFCPSEDFSPRASASCFHEASSHGL
jgi:hypothetical protein